MATARKLAEGQSVRLRMHLVRLTARAPRGEMHSEERMLNRTLIAIIVLAATSAGCTAVNAQLHIEKAESALSSARERGANTGALYEWTLAERFMAKAQEEVRQNHFGAAERLADSAASYADQSIIALESQGRDLEIDESSLDALPDRIGTDLIDAVDVQIDYVDLPDSEMPTSADDVITDDEVEALFGRGAVDNMNAEGLPLQTPGNDTGPAPGEGTAPANGTAPAEGAVPEDVAVPVDDRSPPAPLPSTDEAAPADESAPATPEEPTAPPDDGWQDLTPGDDEL